MAAYLGNISIENAYLGSSAISACYLGSSYIFPLASNATLKYKAAAQVTPNVAYSDSSWTLTLSADTFANSAGTVTFSGTGLTIPANAYSAASITNMTIGKGVISIGDSAFVGCDDLASIKIPNTVTSIGEGAFIACHSLTAVTIPDSVTSLGPRLFWNCHNLTTATLPTGLTTIPVETFKACSALTSFDIPSGVTTIGSSVFSGATSLTALTIPSGVTELGSYAFRDSGIVELTFKGDTPPATMGTGVFSNVSATGVIYCPAAAVSAYTTWAQAYGLSGWTIQGNGLPNVDFLINYNAKRFSNGSIPQEAGALVASALSVNNVTFNTDHLTFNATAETVMNFGSDADNPFNIAPNDMGLTIIAKTGKGNSTSCNLISNRGSSGTNKLNWMYRPKSDNTVMFHTMDGGWDGSGYTLSAYPNVYAFRINSGDSNNGQLSSYTDNTSAATGVITCQTTKSDSIVFFNGYPYSRTEQWTGDFYWIYVARTYLTDTQVEQVINYNENL